MRQRFSRWLSLLTVCFMLAAYGATAQAALQAVGPLDLPIPPGNGFPTFYQDATGRALVPCISLTLLPSGNNACVLPPTEPGWIFGNPVVFPTNYPFEVFYFIADVLGPLTAPAGSPISTLVYRAALEATFGTVAPAPGGQMTFTRIRIRMDAPVAGTYTITHPYGVETINVTTPGIKAINITRDLGVTPFPAGALTGDLGPWLTRVGYPVTVAATGEQFIGDFNVIGPVTGGPNGNVVTVQGPPGSNIDGLGNRTVTISDFAVAGKIFTGQIPKPLTIDRTTYARDAVSGQIDAFVTATTPGAIPAISGTNILTTNLTPDFPAAGKFFTHIPFTPLNLPTGLNINNNLDVPPINHPVNLVDEVNITLANYNPNTTGPGAHTLTIKAASRDKLVPPALSAVGITGPASVDLLDATGTLIKLIPVNTIPPLTVTVNSTHGGSATVPVSVVTPPAAPVALPDTATTVGTAPVAINVLLNDTPTATIDPTTVTIVTPPINGATSVNTINGTVTYTPNAAAVTAGTASFTYRVFDTFAQSSNTVTVTVTITAPAPPPPALPTPPVAVADTAKTAPGTPVTINVLANDTITAPGVINAATVTPVSPLVLAGIGTFVVNQAGNLAGLPVGSVTFTPDVLFTTGSASLIYTVSDSSTVPLVSNQALITVNVAANIPPVANNDVSSTFVGVARIINVKANDTDADGTIAAGPVTIVVQPATATVVPNADGTVTFTPNLAGTYTFTYNVRDNLGAISNDATVTVSVTSPVTDSVTVLKAEYTTATGQWLVEGSTTGVSPLSKTVTIHLGKDLTGQVIGTTPTTAADGRWKFGFNFGAGVLAPALLDRTISVALPSGASRLAFPVAVK